MGIAVYAVIKAHTILERRDRMRFTKMHGLGNDYIFLNCMETLPENLDQLARRLSDRHFGVGGDGIICCLLYTSDAADDR